MLLKSRAESHELLIMRSLNTRLELTEKEKFHYLNLEKGYEGEVNFDLLAESLQEERVLSSMTCCLKLTIPIFKLTL